MSEFKTFRFREWKVYNDAQLLYMEVGKIVQKLPREHRYELGSQIMRSSLSIALNIAEGGGKSYVKELNRFLDIALGSAYETLAALDAMKRNGLIESAVFLKLGNDLEDICRQLGGFKRRVVGRS